ncbi:MAG: hypothetical protein B7Y39_05395 [Bdellovibrio sp. 28-41-41]|nr:MAG: hypothetical protein B7Y39_05395 [Bdellovibrio sp. 28-41-41]
MKYLSIGVFVTAFILGLGLNFANTEEQVIEQSSQVGTSPPASNTAAAIADAVTKNNSKNTLLTPGVPKKNTVTNSTTTPPPALTSPTATEPSTQNSTTTETSAVSLGSCNCKLGSSEENKVELEDPNKCSKDRLYFQTSLKKIDPLFLKGRTEKEGSQFPMACVGYIMRKFMDASAKPSRYYSYCSRAIGKPVRSKKTHCVTEEYVTSVYSSYVDVLDCLDVPQRDLIPKLYNESGFHINTFGAGMDAGVGQLTGPAISSVQQLASFDGKNMTWLENIKEEVNKSTKPSCQRITKIPGLFNKISADSSQRCGLIAAPENPLKNVLYMGIFYHYMLRSQTGARFYKGYTYLPKSDATKGDELVAMDRKNKDIELSGYFREYKIKARIQALGIEKPNMQALKQMMITLGYNSGMESAFIFLDKYLKARLQRKLKLAETDFDFQTHFYSNYAKKLKNPKEEARRIKDMNIIKSAPYRMPFPIFLRVAQRTGSPGYLSAVSNKLLQLDKEMGEGICTTPGFLKF